MKSLKRIFLSVAATLTVSQSAFSQVERANTVIYTKLATMKECYRGEELNPPKPTCLFAHDFTIKYFYDDNLEDVKMRESYRVVFKDGLVRRANTPELVMEGEGKMDYVLDDKGNFYIFNEKKIKEIRHSSLFAGAPLASAGELKLKAGRIIKIDGDSGHYEMTEDVLQNVIDFLSKQSVQLR